MEFHLICDTVSRQQYVYVDKDVIVATNGHCLGVADNNLFTGVNGITHIPETGMLVHRSYWRQIHNAEKLNYDGKYITATFKRKMPVIAPVELNMEYYPNWKNVLYDSDDTKVGSVAVDPKHLHNLCRALGILSAKLEFIKQGRYVKVSDKSGISDNYGILATMTI